MSSAELSLQSVRNAFSYNSLMLAYNNPIEVIRCVASLFALLFLSRLALLSGLPAYIFYSIRPYRIFVYFIFHVLIGFIYLHPNYAKIMAPHKGILLAVTSIVLVLWWVGASLVDIIFGFGLIRLFKPQVSKLYKYFYDPYGQYNIGSSKLAAFIASVEQSSKTHSVVRK